jgi:hypothetical protein
LVLEFCRLFLPADSSQLEVLIDFATRMMADSPISAAFKDLQQRLQAEKKQAQAKSALASHREKRKFVSFDFVLLHPH